MAKHGTEFNLIRIDRDREKLYEYKLSAWAFICQAHLLTQWWGEYEILSEFSVAFFWHFCLGFVKLEVLSPSLVVAPKIGNIWKYLYRFLWIFENSWELIPCFRG